MIGLTLDDPAREAVILRQFQAQRVAMIAMVPAPDGVLPARPGDTPILELVRRRGEAPTAFIGIDDGPAIAEAVKALSAAGHSRIGFIGSHLSLSTGRERRHAFETAAIDLGLELDLVRSVGPTQISGAEAVRHIMAAARPATAIVLGGVEISKGALRFWIEGDGSRVSLLELVAYGDPPWVRWVAPGIRSIALPETALAEAVASRFVTALDGEQSSTVPGDELLAACLTTSHVIGKANRPIEPTLWATPVE